MQPSLPSNSYRIGHGLLRLGVAFAFVYPPLAAIGDPVSWASYFPPFVASLPINTLVLLHTFGVVEVLLALWILSGVRIRIPSIVATIILLAIISVNLSSFEILFRDLSIALATLSLAFLPSPVSSKS